MTQRQPLSDLRWIHQPLHCRVHAEVPFIHMTEAIRHEKLNSGEALLPDALGRVFQNTLVTIIKCNDKTRSRCSLDLQRGFYRHCLEPRTLCSSHHLAKVAGRNV